MDLSVTHLRVLRAVAERGTITAAAQELGYTQSAVSRQIAALERAVGTDLVQRLPTGVRLTEDGSIVLRHARAVFAELDAVRRELSATPPERERVRLGVIMSSGAALVPAVLTALAREHPDVELATREGTTPSLIRSLRAGTLELAIITSRPPFRPPDTELPRLTLETLAERDLLVAAPASGRFAARRSVAVDELTDADWVASPPAGADVLLGVWPDLPGRPRVAHTARDWLTKLHLVAAGAGLTTVPPGLRPLLPDGVVLLRVTGSDQRRRVWLARMPGPSSPGVRAVRAVVRRSAAAALGPD